MSRRPKDLSVGPWAREKLESLSAYLDYYTKRLKNQGHWLYGTYFIDAFAGPGSSPIRGTGPPSSQSDLQSSLFDQAEDPIQAEVEYLRGSPRVALEIANPFSNYIFIEKDAERLRELEEVRAEFTNRRQIEIVSGDANEAVRAFLARGIDWKHHRGVVFLDPFGMQVPLSTIEDIARTRALEVIINFPLAMAITRLITRDGNIPATWQSRLDSSFGGSEWRELAYIEEDTMFGRQKVKRPDADSRLLAWYVERLQNAFGYVGPEQLVRNTRGNPLYYLLWAGPHKAGLEGAAYILGRKKPSRRGR